MPEVFEYQFRPDVIGATTDGLHSYVLAGSTCLAGDLFGEYRFAKELSIGDRLVFPDMGGYTLSRANHFNGYSWPSIYSLRPGGDLQLEKEDGFETYDQLYG